MKNQVTFSEIDSSFPDLDIPAFPRSPSPEEIERLTRPPKENYPGEMDEIDRQLQILMNNLNVRLV